MKLLAIDTATEACSAALSIDGIVDSRYQVAPRLHASLILSMVDDLLSSAELHPADLDVLAFGRGPGAFTGVRIAAGVIQGLAYGSGVPVIPVSTLAALAQGVSARSEYVLSAIDARMGEIYWCGYRTGTDGLVIATTDERVERAEQLGSTDAGPWFGVGTGWATYATELTARFAGQLSGFDPASYPQAKDMIPLARRDYELGRFVSAADALPVYLRNKVTG